MNAITNKINKYTIYNLTSYGAHMFLTIQQQQKKKTQLAFEIGLRVFRETKREK